MDKKQIERIITEAGVRPSPVRTLVYCALADADGPLSSLELEMKLETVDRSSITRSLSLFAERGIVHVVDDGSGSLKYEPCHSTGCGIDDDDCHPHFHCISCGATVCLDNLPVPAVEVPDGYLSMSVNYVVKGICASCRKKD